MFHYLLIALIALFATIPGYATQHDFQKNGVTYVWEESPDYAQSRKVFLDAFIQSYSQIPLDVLRQPSREAMVHWLEGAFEETYSDHQNSKEHLWLSAKVNDRIVGLILIDTKKYPEEIYLSQLAVDPAFQRQGIASTLICSLFEQFPKCAKFVVIPRRANIAAQSLYTSLGFIPSSYMHEGYSPELYTGFEH